MTQYARPVTVLTDPIRDHSQPTDLIALFDEDGNAINFQVEEPTQEAWVSITNGQMSNGWLRLDDANPPQYRKRIDGTVELRGMVAPGSQAKVFTLPVGYRHSAGGDQYFPMAAQGGAAIVFSVKANGDVDAAYGTFGGLAWVNLSSIKFSID